MFSQTYWNEIKAGFDSQMALLRQRGEELAQGACQCPGGTARASAGDAADRIQASGGSRQAHKSRLPGLCRELLREKEEEISRAFARCTPEEAQALAFLYSASPLSDILDYPASLYLAYARHGVFLWSQGSFAGRVPERLFANYVLHHRVNNEDIADTRGFFYDKLRELVPPDPADWQMYDAAMDVNYWSAREATYRSTDIRTQNARTMYGTATGRCGEESTFMVTLLRSMGIPARQVYAPLWTHCDDNHAWVEAWCDGKWYFLGACEPEEALNRGWFIEPASRAMILHSRWFGKDMPEEPQVGRKGMARVLNHMERYARTTSLEIRAVDEAGMPIPRARLTFQVPNHGELGTVAVVYTGSGSDGQEPGVASLTTGFGDLYVAASARGLYGEKMLSLKDTRALARFTVVLGTEPEIGEGWRDLEFHAPAPAVLYDGELTREQVQRGSRRLEQAVAYRQRKVAGFYQERESVRVLDRFTGADRIFLEELLHNARSNMGELVRFLEWNLPGLSGKAGSQGNLTLQNQVSVRGLASQADASGKQGEEDTWKLNVLKTLREKDSWDIRAEVLTDCVLAALPYVGKMPEEIFFPYVVCPRVADEMLRPCRLALEEVLGEEEKAAIRRDPGRLPGLLEKWVISVPEGEYEDLITSPMGCLRGGMGSEMSRKVLCVNLYRSLGIPARLNPLDDTVEYYRGEGFVAAGREEAALAELVLCEDGSLKLTDLEHYRLERFDKGQFQPIGLWGEQDQIQEGSLEVRLLPGIYRIFTTNRRKNGDQLLRFLVFELHAGEKRRVVLSMRKVPLEDMLTSIKVTDFPLVAGKVQAGQPTDWKGWQESLREGQQKGLFALTGGRKALFLWLEVTREPTEHILYELYDRREAFARLHTPLYVVLRSPEDLENATLRRTMEVLPGLCPLLDDFGEHYETLARSVGREVGKLPLALVLNGEGVCIYSDAGYNVGLADMLWRVLEG